jgi:Uma2 family endonuclease
MALEATRETPARPMTEEEFVAWCDEDTRAEFVDGRVVVMSPEARIHVRITQLLVQLLGLYLEVRPGGELLGPNFQIRLRTGLRRVPDLLFVASDHADRVQETFVDGAPDAAWEIISPDSVDRDWREKFYEYETAGIHEYWIIDPYTRTVHLYQLGSDGKYQRTAEQEGRLTSAAIPGFWLKPEWFWQDPLPKVMDCLREMEVLS